ncbi:hypothetical protein COOONC_26441 [Cooperia oncophora]
MQANNNRPTSLPCTTKCKDCTLVQPYVVPSSSWIRQTLQQIHANDTLRAVNKWFSDELFNQMTAVNDQVQAYQNGLFNETLLMNNLDIGNELQKIRGGSIFNDINMHMNIKLQCLNKSAPECKWISGLKYYVYSAMKYHQNEENATLYPITHFIGPCEGQLFCELDIFGTFANRTKPEQPMVEVIKICWRSLSS